MKLDQEEVHTQIMLHVQHASQLSIRNVIIHTPDTGVFIITQPAFTFSKLTIETLEQGVKYVQS